MLSMHLSSLLQHIKSFYAPVANVRGTLCFTLVRLSVFPSHLKSLYNQFLLQFLSSWFKTLHKCLRCAPPLLKWKKNHFWQNYSGFGLWNFTVSGLYTVESLYNQLLLQVLSNQIELCTNAAGRLKMCIFLFEEKKNHFWQNYGIFGLRNFTVSG